jgi:lipopolysaccharide export system protein LptC
MMSSLTDSPIAQAHERAEAAVRRARLAPILSALAAAAGLAVIAAFVVQAGLFSTGGIDATGPAAQIERPEQISSGNARVAGFDRERQPYELVARRGYQDKDKPDLVHMEEITGAFRKQSGQSYQITSGAGLYDTKLKRMDLSGGVKIVEPGRMTARMEKARVGVEEKSLLTDVPVDVVMDTGRITANGMKISDDGRTILFLNGVKARFGDDGKGDKPE